MTARPAAAWPLPAAIALSSSMIDVLGWLSLAHFYSANVTGDLAQGVTYVLPGVRPHVLEIAAPGVFLATLAACYLAVRRLGDDDRRLLRVLFLAQSALLLIVATLEGAFNHGGSAPGAGSRLAVGLICVATICLSNATMNIVDHEAPTTWALTANCVRAVVALLDVALKHGTADDRHRQWRVWMTTWPTILTFLAGAIVAREGLSVVGAHAWLLPLAATGICALVPWRARPILANHP